MFNKRQREFRKRIRKGEKEFAKKNPGGYVSYIEGDYIDPNKRKYKSNTGRNVFLLVIISFMCYGGYKYYSALPKQSININIDKAINFTNQSTSPIMSKQEQIAIMIDNTKQERISMASTIQDITNSYQGNSISPEYAQKLKDKTFAPITCPENLTELSDFTNNINNEVAITNELIKLRNSNHKNTNEQRLQINSLINQYNGYAQIDNKLLINIFEQENMKYEIQNNGQLRYWYQTN